jgi:hypothetical protein
MYVSLPASDDGGEDQAPLKEDQEPMEGIDRQSLLPLPSVVSAYSMSAWQLPSVLGFIGMKYTTEL